MTAPRPRRQRRGDRLTDPHATAEQMRCDHAVAPFDRIAWEMDRKWGVDRLPALVAPATAERYGSALAKLNAALAANDPELTAAKAAVAIKGLQFMDAEAEAAGKEKARGDLIEHEHAGFQFAVILDADEWPAAQDRTKFRIFTLNEIAVALQHYCDRYPISEVKALFPKAQITAINEKPPLDEDAGGDEIPF